ncbi:hypothetical protein ACXOKH_02465 [Streptococcus thermophilus]|nr:hypothetical protein [Streptococcus thermophilus]
MFVGIGLVGCQNDSKKSEGNPKVKQSKVHTAKSDPFQKLIDSSKSTDEIYVTDDITVGEKGDVKPGIYDIEVTGGSGNIFGTRKSEDGPHINFLAGTVGNDINYASKIRLILFDGDTLQLENISKVKFNAVAKEVEPSNELGQGEFIVGRDIKEGTYKLSTNVNLNPEFSNLDLGWSLTIEDLDSNTSKSQEYNPGNTDVVVKLKKNQVLSIYYDGLSDESTKADDAKLIFTEYK